MPPSHICPPLCAARQREHSSDGEGREGGRKREIGREREREREREEKERREKAGEKVISI